MITSRPDRRGHNTHTNDFCQMTLAGGARTKGIVYSPADILAIVRRDAAAKLGVARELCAVLKPCCAKIMVAGSLRRRKSEVGDVEILYLPNIVKAKDPGDFFGKEIAVNAVDRALEQLLAAGALERRRKVTGSITWGPENKLARHVASGIPVDLFTATHDNWWNLVVGRTGPLESNIRIATAAQERGWKWEPYSAGFTRPSIEKGGGYVDVKVCRSEREVFEFVELEYLPPHQRL